MCTYKFLTFLGFRADLGKFLGGGGGMSEVGQFGAQNEPKLHKNQGKRRKIDSSGKENGGRLGSTVSIMSPTSKQKDCF